MFSMVMIYVAAFVGLVVAIQVLYGFFMIRFGEMGSALLNIALLELSSAMFALAVVLGFPVLYFTGLWSLSILELVGLASASLVALAALTYYAFLYYNIILAIVAVQVYRNGGKISNRRDRVRFRRQFRQWRWLYSKISRRAGINGDDLLATIAEDTN